MKPFPNSSADPPVPNETATGTVCRIWEAEVASETYREARTSLRRQKSNTELTKKQQKQDRRNSFPRMTPPRYQLVGIHQHRCCFEIDAFRTSRIYVVEIVKKVFRSHGSRYLIECRKCLLNYSRKNANMGLRAPTESLIIHAPHDATSACLPLNIATVSVCFNCQLLTALE